MNARDGVLRPGDMIGTYSVVSAIGQGAFAHIYKATDADGNLVVLKLPDSNLMGDPMVYERFQREFVAGQRLDHPNICRVLTMGKTDRDLPFLVLQYAEGETLRNYLRQKAPLPPDEAVSIATQLAGALAHAHSQGVFHRDLKPENLIRSSDGQVRIVDFGIALVEGARRMTYRFLTDAAGTPDYMAPEQIQGKRGDARTDVYALGVIVYEMLTGEVPFTGDNPFAVMSQHLNKTPEPPASKNKKVPAALSAVTMKALRRDPDERYQTMLEFRGDLSNYQKIDPASLGMAPEPQGKAVSSDVQIILKGVFIAVGFLLAVAIILGVTIMLKRS